MGTVYGRQPNESGVQNARSNSLAPNGEDPGPAPPAPGAGNGPPAPIGAEPPLSEEPGVGVLKLGDGGSGGNELITPVSPVEGLAPPIVVAPPIPLELPIADPPIVEPPMGAPLIPPGQRHENYQLQ